MASALRTVMAASIGAAVALGVGAPVASAAVATPAPTRLDPALDAVLPALSGPVDYVPLNPLAGGGFNPVDNSVGTQVGDLPVSTAMATGQIAEGTTLRGLIDSTGLGG
jgi:hypothetical protein